MFIGILHSGMTDSQVDEMVSVYTGKEVTDVIRFNTLPAEALLAQSESENISRYGRYFSAVATKEDIHGEFILLYCLDDAHLFHIPFTVGRITNAVYEAKANMEAAEVAGNQREYLNTTVNADNMAAHFLATVGLFEDIPNEVTYLPFNYDGQSHTAIHYKDSYLMTCYAVGFLEGMSEAKAEKKQEHRDRVASTLTVIDGGK